MKKMILCMFAIGFMTTFAKTTITMGTNEVDAVQFCTQYAEKHSNSVIPVGAERFKDVDEDVVEDCDDVLSDVGTYAPYFSFKKMFPKCSLNYAEIYAKENCPQDVEFIVNYVNSNDSQSTIDQLHIHMSICEYHYRATKTIPQNIIDTILSTLAPKQTKLHLRSQGKSFVDKDGISPVKVKVDAIAAGFNAPKLTGLKEALADIGADFGYDFVSMSMSDDEINSLKEKILVDDEKFSDKNQRVLRFALGVEEYNKFVKLYNGDN